MIDATVERFVSRAREVGSTVHLVDGWTRAAAAIDEVAGAAVVEAHDDASAGSVTASDGKITVGPHVADAYPFLLAGLGRGVRAATEDAAAMADTAVGIVAGELAVAESGSVLVDESGLADRLVSMFSQTLVQVVAASRVVADLDDAAEWLRGRMREAPAYAVLVSGPSRTADIERSLTIGVQGPAAVHVVLVG